MPPVAPQAATVAAKNRKETAQTDFDQGNHGTLDETVKANTVKHNVLGVNSHYKNLDTVKDQQTPTKPIAALPGQSSTTAHGSVGDNTF